MMSAPADQMHVLRHAADCRYNQCFRREQEMRVYCHMYSVVDKLRSPRCTMGDLVLELEAILAAATSLVRRLRAKCRCAVKAADEALLARVVELYGALRASMVEQLASEAGYAARTSLLGELHDNLYMRQWEAILRSTPEGNIAEVFASVAAFPHDDAYPFVHACMTRRVAPLAGRDPMRFMPDLRMPDMTCHDIEQKMFADGHVDNTDPRTHPDMRRACVVLADMVEGLRRKHDDIAPAPVSCSERWLQAAGSLVREFGSNCAVETWMAVQDQRAQDVAPYTPFSILEDWQEMEEALEGPGFFVPVPAGKFRHVKYAMMKTCLPRKIDRLKLCALYGGMSVMGESIAEDLNEGQETTLCPEYIATFGSTFMLAQRDFVCALLATPVVSTGAAQPGG